MPKRVTSRVLTIRICNLENFLSYQCNREEHLTLVQLLDQIYNIVRYILRNIYHEKKYHELESISRDLKDNRNFWFNFSQLPHNLILKKKI